MTKSICGHAIKIKMAKGICIHALRKGEKRVSRSVRAGLIFPVSRIRRYLKKYVYNSKELRIGITAAIYLG